MIRTKKNTLFSFLIVLLSLLIYAEVDAYQSSNLVVVNEIPVGVILATESWVGKVVHSCISMAISDFYALNTQYKTRVALHTRDSKGEPLRALSAALDLLENIKVQAIIGPETSLEGNFLALLESFRWRKVILVYEDTDCGRGIIPNLANDPNIHITYMSSISPSATNDQILEELVKLMTMQTTIYIVHMSPSLASRLFLNVKRLGMMSEGYAWIVTDKTMNLLDTMDSSAIESMQGVLGFKSYIPASDEIRNFTLRWRRNLHIMDPSFEVGELNVFGAWAYDAIWALARAVERVGVELEVPPTRMNLTDLANIGASQSGSMLLKEILQSRFTGLSGKFQFTNGRLISEAFEIVNVLGRGERSVGFWTSTNGTTKELYPSINGIKPSAKRGLEAIVWPGGSTTIPKGWLMRMSGKRLRIGVPLQHGFKELVNVDHDPQTNATIVTGFCIDVFNAAIEALQYEVAYEFIPYEDANGQSAGTYGDLVDQVYFQNYDAVVGDVTITANRSLYVDFTSTYTDTGVGMVARIDNKRNMWIFLKPLDSDLWLASAGFFILTGFVVWVIEHPINESFQGSRAQQIGTALWFSFSTLVFAHREKLLSNLSRFVVIVWVFVVLILTSSYTATLTSLLTVQQIQLASKENYYIGYQGGSLLRGFIANNFNFKDPWLKTYYSPEEYADALSNGSVVAIIDEIPYLKIFLAKYSSYAMVSSKSNGNGFGFVFQKGSPLVPEISRAIAGLREEGKLMTLEKAWFKSPSFISTTQQDSVMTNPNILNLDSFRGLFLISGISSALAVLIRLIYILHKKWHAKISDFRNLVWGELLLLMKYYLPNQNSDMIAQSNAT